VARKRTEITARWLKPPFTRLVRGNGLVSLDEGFTTKRMLVRSTDLFEQLSKVESESEQLCELSQTGVFAGN